MRNKITPPYGLKAFTLSEVLITLVIIGVITAITLPVINSQIRKEQYRSSLFKAISVLNQAALKYYNIYGENAKCGYWKKNPYEAGDNAMQCTDRNEEGDCISWKLKDGSDVPSDYHGFFDDCENLWQSYYETLSAAKICKNNAYKNGCIPEYKGYNEIHGGNYEGAPFPDKESINKGSAIVLNDGMIIFSYQVESSHFLAVDVNGQKGPNKWGTDVYAVRPQKTDLYSPPEFYPSDDLIEQGGMSVKNLLYL